MLTNQMTQRHQFKLGIHTFFMSRRATLLGGVENKEELGLNVVALRDALHVVVIDEEALFVVHALGNTSTTNAEVHVIVITNK